MTAMHRPALAFVLLAAITWPSLAADPQFMISIKDHQFVPSESRPPRRQG